MNGRRWLVLSLFLAGLTSLSLVAHGQDKTDKSTKKTDKATVKDTAKETGKGTGTATKKVTEPEKKAEASGEAKLLPKAFEGKDAFYQEVTTTTTQNMTVMMQKITQEQKQTFYYSYTPSKDSKADKYIVVQKILGVKMDIDIGGNKISFDSTKGEQQKNPMSEFFSKLVGAEFTLTIEKDKDGRFKVEDVKGLEDFVNKLGNVNQAMMPLLKKILTKEAIKGMAEPMLGVIPPNGVVPKDKTWKSDSSLDMGPIGKYMTDNKYTYEGATDAKTPSLVKIKVDSELTYSPPMGGEKGGLPFVIVKDESTKLKSKDSGGTIWFNTDKGRVESADMNVKLDGSLKIEIANMQTLVELNQTQVSKLKTFDTNPLEKMAK